MAQKTTFNREEEDQLIEFIRNNEILHNVRHKRFRQQDEKDRLWTEFANKINMDAEIVKNKWKDIRDNFRCDLTEQSTGSAASSLQLTKERFEALQFLVDTPYKRRTLNMESSSSTESSNDNFEFAPRGRKRSQSADTLDLLRALSLCTKNLETALLKKKNHVEIFFESISSMVCTMPPDTILELQKRISHLVYDEADKIVRGCK